MATINQSPPPDRMVLRPNVASANYIEEIDALRGVAVIAVMLYHAEPTWLPGGFTGVDVFFVISGYLITQIILHDLEQQKFSFINFWERRARRILPALFAVLIPCSVAAWFYFSPVELRGFAASAIASLGFGANFYFWQDSADYFALAAQKKPLLHLWSLGVEEQFYLLYPAFLIILWRYAQGRVVFALLVGVIASFIISWYAAENHPVAAFFLLFTRAWEIGAGCLLAVFTRQKLVLYTQYSSSIVVIAAAVMLATFFVVDGNTPWPGPAALPLVAATVAIIAYGPHSDMTRPIFKFRPLLLLGLASYGIYLWHHVLLSFARVISPSQLNLQEVTLILLISVVLGWASYSWIEQPARDRLRISTPQFWTAVSVSLILLAGANYWIWQGKGMPSRLPPKLQLIAEMPELYPSKIDPCFFNPGPVSRYESACLVGSLGPIATAIVGDSHAATLAPGFRPLLHTSGTRARLLSAAGCPYIDNSHALSAMQSHCATHTKRMHAAILADPQIRLVAIAARWPYAFNRAFFDNGEGGVETGPDDGLQPDPTRDKLFEKSLVRLTNELRAAGKTTLVIYPIPEPGWHVPNYLISDYLLGTGKGMPTISEAHWREWASTSIAMLDRLEEGPDLLRLKPAEMLCGSPEEGRCVLGAGGIPFYFDDDHPNELGASLMISEAARRQGISDKLIKVMREPVAPGS